MKILIALFIALRLATPPGLHASAPARNAFGPIRYPGISPRVTEAGVEAPAFHFDPHSVPKPQRWDAQWISLSKGDPAVTYFRKEVVLNSAPSRVIAWVSAHSAYRLYVNGQLVSRGPDDIGHDVATKASHWTHQWLADARDLSAYFHQGKNVLAAEVFSRTSPFAVRYPAVRNGLFFQAEAHFDSQPSVAIQSDASWRAAASAGWTEGKWTPLSEEGVAQKEISTLRVDTAQEPEGWREDGFDDSRWETAAPMASDHGPMRVSEIPPRMEAVWPATRIIRANGGAVDAPRCFEERRPVVLNKDGAFSVQFDRVLSAFYGLRCRGGKGAVITVMPSERNRSGYGRRSTSLVLKGGAVAFESPMFDSFTVLNIEVRNVTEPVEIEEIRAHFVSQPVEYRGAFACSDEKLNRVWEALRRNVQVCMQTHHLDSPNHQEPLGDAGDYLVESLANWQAFHAPALVRQDLRKIAWIMEGCGYRMFHTSYQLLWLQMLVEYHRHTGDGALVLELAPFVNKLLDRFASYRGTNGLLSNAPDFMFMDFRNIGGVVCHHPPAVIGQGFLTALFCRALEDGERVAQLAEDLPRVALYRRLRGEVTAAFERELWNPKQGLYRDGKPFQSTVQPHQWLPKDTEIETFSPHVNLLAVLYGIAPPERHRALCNALAAAEPKLNVSPYFLHFALPALDRAGWATELALPLIRDTVIQPESGTVPELGRSGDLSHGWVSGPLIHLSQRILGVAPVTPGFKTFAIHPNVSGLSWAKGRVPTPHGDVAVAWSVTAGGFALDVTVPPGTAADVFLPSSSEPVRVEAGKHHLETKQ